MVQVSDLDHKNAVLDCEVVSPRSKSEDLNYWVDGKSKSEDLNYLVEGKSKSEDLNYVGLELVPIKLLGPLCLQFQTLSCSHFLC